MRVLDSSEKVENVVNPPQIPVFKKRVNFGFEIDPFEASMATRAIAMQPAMLIINVSCNVSVLEKLRKIPFDPNIIIYQWSLNNQYIHDVT